MNNDKSWLNQGLNKPVNSNQASDVTQPINQQLFNDNLLNNQQPLFNPTVKAVPICDPHISIGTAFKHFFSYMFKFQGETGVKEYWFSFIMYVIMQLVLSTITVITCSILPMNLNMVLPLVITLGILLIIEFFINFSLFTTTIRRYRSSKAGVFIPIVMYILNTVLFLTIIIPILFPPSNTIMMNPNALNQLQLASISVAFILSMPSLVLFCIVVSRKQCYYLNKRKILPVITIIMYVLMIIAMIVLTFLSSPFITSDYDSLISYNDSAIVNKYYGDMDEKFFNELTTADQSEKEYVDSEIVQPMNEYLHNLGFYSMRDQEYSIYSTVDTSFYYTTFNSSSNYVITTIDEYYEKKEINGITYYFYEKSILFFTHSDYGFNVHSIFVLDGVDLTNFINSITINNNPTKNLALNSTVLEDSGND